MKDSNELSVVEKPTKSSMEWMDKMNIASFTPCYLYGKDTNNSVGFAELKNGEYAILTRDVMLWYDEVKYIINKKTHKAYKKLMRSAYGVKGETLIKGTKEECEAFLDSKFFGKTRWDYIINDLKNKYVNRTFI